MGKEWNYTANFNRKYAQECFRRLNLYAFLVFLSVNSGSAWAFRGALMAHKHTRTTSESIEKLTSADTHY